MMDFLAGQTILSLELGSMLRIFTHEGWQLDLEGDIDVTTPGGGVERLHKGEPPMQLPPALAALPDQTLRRVAVSGEGDLLLDLGGLQLLTRSDSDYESWQVYGPQGEIYICGPGSEMTVFGPRAEDDV